MTCIRVDIAKIPSKLEPSGINRSDGKKPDRVTLCPWKCGRILAWDFTCPDTFSSLHVSLAACEAGNVANEAEHKKKVKYSNLGDQYLFVPLAVETSGSFGSAAMSFIKELGRRIRDNTGDVLLLFSAEIVYRDIYKEVMLLLC